MRKTREASGILKDRITINTMELQELLGCGRPTATQIGLAANAKVNIAKNRVLWNAKKIQQYIDSVSE